MEGKIKCDLAKYASTTIFGKGSRVREFVGIYCEQEEKIGTLLKALVPAVKIALNKNLRSPGTWEDMYNAIGCAAGLKTAFTTPEINTALKYGKKIYDSR